MTISKLIIVLMSQKKYFRWISKKDVQSFCCCNISQNMREYGKMRSVKTRILAYFKHRNSEKHLNELIYWKWVAHWVKYWYFTEFPGVEILWKHTVYAEFQAIRPNSTETVCFQCSGIFLFPSSISEDANAFSLIAYSVREWQ